MKKSICPECGEEISVQETEIQGNFKLVSHTRVAPRELDDSEEGVHLRNVRDIPCNGSGKVIE